MHFQTSPTRVPNLLLVMADQLSPGTLPSYGNPVVRAPRISGLAETGVQFDHAYCPSPLCAPSRASLMTGRLPSRIGVYDNGAELAASVPTVAHHLRRRGYRTWLAGKMHFIGPDQLHGFERRLTPDIYPAGMHWIPDWEAPLGQRLPWYHDMTSVFEAGPSEATLQLDYDDEVAFRSVRAIHDLAREDDGRPFFLVASFSHPHDPWEVPQRYWDAYAGTDAGSPRVPFIPDSDLDPHSRRVREMCGGLGLEIPEEAVARARLGHYAAVSYVDEKVGELVDALARSGLAGETVIVFAADHGEMLGERGLWYKMSFFEPSATVPLIFHGPGRWEPRRVAAPVSLLDLLPTLAELGGVEEPLGPDPVDGSSLVPLLAGGRGGETIAAEFLAEGAVAPVVMLRRGARKFVHSAPDPDQLFDLEADPDELVNLAALPDHAAEVGEFKAEVARRWDLGRIDGEVRDSQRRRRFLAEATAVGEPPDWDYQPDAGRSDRYVRGFDFWAPFARARLRPPPDAPGSGS